MKKYAIQKTGQNLQNEGLYSVVNLETESVLKSNLLAKDANLFIENLTLLEEIHDYLDKKYLDMLRIKEDLNIEHQELLFNNYGHDVETLILKLERQINSFQLAQNYEQAEILIKRLEKFKTREAPLTWHQRIKRAYYLIKTL
jgi:hypothetical protein